MILLFLTLLLMQVPSAAESWFSTPTVKAVLITGVFSLLVFFAGMYERYRAAKKSERARLEDEARRDKDAKEKIDDSVKAAEENLRVKLIEANDSMLGAARQTITTLAAEVEKLARTSAEMQTNMFAASAEVARLTRDNAALISRAQTAEDLLTACRSSREAQTRELETIRELLRQAQEAVRQGGIQVEKEKYEQQREASGERKKVSGP